MELNQREIAALQKHLVTAVIRAVDDFFLNHRQLSGKQLAEAKVAVAMRKKGATFAEIANKLGFSINTARSRVDIGKEL